MPWGVVALEMAIMFQNMTDLILLKPDSTWLATVFLVLSILSI